MNSKHPFRKLKQIKNGSVPGGTEERRMPNNHESVQF